MSMSSVFKLEKQGEIAAVGYRPGQTPSEPEQPHFFASLAAAEKHMAEVLSCDVARVLNGPVGRIYKSHLGTFALTEHPLHGADPALAKPETAAAPEAPKAE